MTLVYPQFQELLWLQHLQLLLEYHQGPQHPGRLKYLARLAVLSSQFHLQILEFQLIPWLQRLPFYLMHLGLLQFLLAR